MQTLTQSPYRLVRGQITRKASSAPRCPTRSHPVTDCFQRLDVPLGLIGSLAVAFHENPHQGSRSLRRSPRCLRLCAHVRFTCRCAWNSSPEAIMSSSTIHFRFVTFTGTLSFSLKPWKFALDKASASTFLSLGTHLISSLVPNRSIWAPISMTTAHDGNFVVIILFNVKPFDWLSVDIGSIKVGLDRCCPVSGPNAINESRTPKASSIAMCRKFCPSSLKAHRATLVASLAHSTIRSQLWISSLLVPPSATIRQCRYLRPPPLHLTSKPPTTIPLEHRKGNGDVPAIFHARMSTPPLRTTATVEWRSGHASKQRCKADPGTDDRIQVPRRRTPPFQGFLEIDPLVRIDPTTSGCTSRPTTLLGSV